MEKNFTQLDLVRFIYRETSVTETIAISAALENDPLLAEEYEEIYEGYKMLPKATFSPRPSAIQSILRYSDQTALNTAH